ncbi:MAG: hypothetical protein JWO70_1308 [Betaproteobacteria bacterium]|nr:hypothetical protein [Betaproteobacteria bacterium]
MPNLWPWMAVAGLGALHGLNPATGWMLAAAWGVRARDETQVRRALVPIAIGHAASIAVVACVFAQGLTMDRALTQGLAGALLVGAASYRMLRGAGQRNPMSAQAGHAGIALWSFLMATAHGAGLMLLPALVSLCLADNPAREITASGSLLLALAAVGVHTAAMLVTTGLIATGICRGVAMHPRLLSSAALRQAWTAALAMTGVLLIAFR